MENALRAKPLEIREQYERQLRGLQEACGESLLELLPRERIDPAARQRGRKMILEP
jgi:putative transposase